MKLSTRALLNLGLVIVAGMMVLLVMIDPGKETEKHKTVSFLDKKTITHILLHRANQEDLVLEKRDNTWYVTAPYQYPANDFKVDSLLQLVSTESKAQYPVEQLDIVKYGLSEPKATVTLNHDQVFSFGSTEPLQQQRYLRYHNTLHLITDTFYYQVAAPATAFLNHTLIPGGTNITKIVVPKLTAELHEGKWTATPTPKELSADQITAFIDAWRFAQALQVAPYDGKPITPTIKIYRQGESSPLEFGAFIRGNDYVLVRNDLHLQFILSADKRKDLLELPAKIELDNSKAAVNPAADEHRP
jgi:hypothetical protein